MAETELYKDFKAKTTIKPPRLPIPAISSMNNLYTGFNFIVTLNAFVFGFRGISGIEIDIPCDSISEGGVNDHTIFVRTNVNSQFELTFERGLILRSPTYMDPIRVAAAKIPVKELRFATLQGINALDPQESLESGPTFGTISLYSKVNQLVGLYTFTSFGIRRWSLAGVDADSSTLLIESLTIVHSGLARKAVTYSPAIITAGFTIADDIQRENESSEIADDIQEKEKNLKTLSKDLENLSQKFEDKKAKYDIANLQEKIENANKYGVNDKELKEELEALKEKTDDEEVKKEIDKLKEKVDNLPKRIKTNENFFDKELEKLSEKFEDEETKEKIEELQKELKNASVNGVDHEELKEKFAELKAKAVGKDLKKEIDELSKKVDLLPKRIDVLKGKIDDLENDVNKGYLTPEEANEAIEVLKYGIENEQKEKAKKNPEAAEVYDELIEKLDTMTVEIAATSFSE